MWKFRLERVSMDYDQNAYHNAVRIRGEVEALNTFSAETLLDNRGHGGARAEDFVRDLQGACLVPESMYSHTFSDTVMKIYASMEMLKDAMFGRYGSTHIFGPLPELTEQEKQYQSVTPQSSDAMLKLLLKMQMDVESIKNQLTKNGTH